MPKNFPDAWRSRVENKLKAGDQAPWLVGMDEVEGPVIVLNGGTMSEKNQINLPISDFDADILIDFNGGEIPVQNYEDDTVTLNLNKYQSKRVPVSDDQSLGASYSMIDNATGGITRNMLIKKYKRAIYNIAPAANTADTPVLKTTGRTGEYNSNGDEIIRKDANGLLYCTVADLVDLKQAFDDLEIPEVGRRLVLSPNHYNQLLKEKDWKEILLNMQTGKVVPMIAGFEIYQYLLNPVYNGTNKLPFEAVPQAGQYKASVAFYVPNIAIKTGFTRQYFTPATIDTATQSNTVAYRHYFMCLPKRAMYMAAIVSDTAVGN